MEYPKYADIKIKIKRHVLSIYLNRPYRKNALRPETISELIHAFKTAKQDEEVRVLVLRGRGGFFCSGADLKAFAKASEEDEESPIPIDPEGFPKLNLLFETIGKPIIAMVEGAAVAGGFGLMMACQFSYAAENAKFSTPEIKRGLWPMMIMRHIFRNIPFKRAIDLILTGRTISAHDAERLGALTKVVAKDRLEAVVYETAEHLASMSPAIVRLGLDALYKQFNMESQEAFPFLDAQLKACMQTEDFAEGISAFAEKRDPVWKGK